VQQQQCETAVFTIVVLSALCGAMTELAGSYVLKLSQGGQPDSKQQRDYLSGKLPTNQHLISVDCPERILARSNRAEFTELAGCSDPQLHPCDPGLANRIPVFCPPLMHLIHRQLDRAAVILG